VVRVVHAWFTDSDKWDNQFEGHSHGWVSFFRIPRLYLAHFAGQPCAATQLMAMTAIAKPEAWATLTTSAGLAGMAEGQGFATTDAPAMTGVVERVGEAAYPEELLFGNWVCSMSAEMVTYEGEIDEKGDTITLSTTMPNPEQGGKPIKARDTITFLADGHRTIVSTSLMDDGKWFAFFRSETRKK